MSNTNGSTALKEPSNIATKRDGDILWLGIDMTKRVGPSKSGKTDLVATTHGSVDVGDGVRLSVNAFAPKAKAA